MFFDLPPEPPKLWLPPKPAIIRQASPDLAIPKREMLSRARRRAAGGGVPDIILGTIANYTGGSATTYTATGLASVAAGERGLIFIAGDGAVRTVNSVIIGGSAGAEVHHVNSVGGSSTAAMWIGPVGASGDVVVTLSGSWSRISISCLPCQNIQSATPTATASATAGDPLSANINCLAGGAVFGCAYNTNAGTFTWTGITEKFDNNPSAGRNASGAADIFATAQTGLTVTADPSGSAANHCMALAALR